MPEEKDMKALDKSLRDQGFKPMAESSERGENSLTMDLMVFFKKPVFVMKRITAMIKQFFS